MLQYLIKRPIIIAAVGCIISAVCGFYSKAALTVCFIAILLGTVLAIKMKHIASAVVCFLILAVTASCFFTLNKIDALNSRQGTVCAEVCVLGTSYKGSKYFKTEVEVIKGDTLPKGTKLSLWHSPAVLSAGDVINATFTPQPIDESYKGTNYGNGIYLSGNMTGYSKCGYTDPVLTAVEKLRNYIKSTLFGNMSHNSAATMCALVFGDRSYFSDSFYTNVKASGVAHVMVVSGMHLTILVTMMLSIFKRLVYSPYLKALIIILTVCALCTLCGFTMSIMRAGVTYIIISLGLIIKRQYSGINALASAVVIILFFSPFAIMNIGFQLSALSTFGILAISAPICDYLDTVKIISPVRWLLKSVTMTLSALLLTLPIVIHTFGYVSVVSVITNLLIDIPVNMCLCLTVIFLFLYPVIPFLSSAAFALIDYAVSYINFVINHLGSQSFATVNVPDTYTYAAVFLIFCVFGVMVTCKKKQDMLKLGEINKIALSEAGGRIKWQS